MLSKKKKKCSIFPYSMMSPQLPNGKSSQRVWWVITVICLTTTSHAISQRSFLSYYRRPKNDLPGDVAPSATTTLTLSENPVLPTWEDDEEGLLPSTTSPAPADTLNSPQLDAYLPVTPSITPTSNGDQGKAIVRPFRRRISPEQNQLVPRRSWSPRDPWRTGSVRGLQRWPLQALDEKDRPPKIEDDDDQTLRWWVTNEPQLTLVAPDTNLNRKTPSDRYSDKRGPPTRHEIKVITSRAPLGIQQSYNPTTYQPSFPTTVAEDPAVLQSPQDFIRNTEDRHPRWFPLDRIFRMITMGTDGECKGRDGRLGVCMLEGACRNAGGTPSSSCSFGYGNCCIAYKTGCGLDVTTNRTYWVSPIPGTNSVVRTGGTCLLRVFKVSPNVCQIRLDLNRFTLAGPEGGNCLKDRLIVSGHNINNFIPKICGENSGQHMYIDVDTVSGPIELSINTVGEGLARSWEIEVSQIACNSPHRPPANCLQYYRGAQGSFSSFNYVPNNSSQYLNNLNYAICLRKEAGFCSVVYNNQQRGITKEFEIVNFRIGPTGLATSVVPVGEAGVGLIQCPDDYLVLAGTRLCGDRLNDGSNDPQPTNNGPVTDDTNGPFTVKFTSNTHSTGIGFQLQFQQYPC